MPKFYYQRNSAGTLFIKNEREYYDMPDAMASGWGLVEAESEIHARGIIENLDISTRWRLERKMDIVHVAGMEIDVRGRIIQRCAICGEILIDIQTGVISGAFDNNPATYPTWTMGRMVFIDAEGNPSQLPETGKLPPNSCAHLLWG